MTVPNAQLSVISVCMSAIGKPFRLPPMAGLRPNAPRSSLTVSSFRPGFISVTSTKIAPTEAVNVTIKALAIAVLATCGLAASRTDVHAQSIEPRSYSNAPVGVNFLIGGYAYMRG